MKRGPQGTWVKRTEVDAHRAFVPHPLPPVPALDFTSLSASSERAHRALGRLDGVTMMLPDPKLFLSFCARKEAVASAQIAGAPGTLSDLLLSELTGQPGDAEEATRGLHAAQRAVDLLRGGLPLSGRLIKEVHEVLVPGRHAVKQASAFRRSPVWLGGTSPADAVFVPAPWNEVARCMLELENSMDDLAMPPLIKAGLVHAQFETIHPFLEGNGRIGRVLITVMLLRDKALGEGWLPLSVYFKQHRAQYVDLLMGTRETGDWEAWLEFFLHAIETTAEYAHFTARKMVALLAGHVAALNGLKGPGKKAVLSVQQQLAQRPISDVKALALAAGVSPQATTKALAQLKRLGMVRPVSKRVVAYGPLVDLLQNDLPL